MLFRSALYLKNAIWVGHLASCQRDETNRHGGVLLAFMSAVVVVVV